jgi:hypothetical protein
MIITMLLINFNGKKTVTLQVLPQYDQELQRFFFAFSCFEKDIDYVKDSKGGGSFHIKIWYRLEEEGFILSRIRFLGRFIKVITPVELQQKMRESALKALRNYF